MGRRVILVLDNAGWHKTRSLQWHHIEPVYPPPYSPDFNPIERLWQHLKSHYLAGYITKHGEQLNEKLFTSMRALLAARKPSAPFANSTPNNGNFFGNGPI